MQCPVCGTKVEHDFGVTACSKCQAVLFVDMDGNVQVSGGPTAIDDELTGPPEGLNLDSQMGIAAPAQAEPEVVESISGDFDIPIQINETEEQAQDILATSQSEIQVEKSSSQIRTRNNAIENYFDSSQGGGQESLGLPQATPQTSHQDFPAEAHLEAQDIPFEIQDVSATADESGVAGDVQDFGVSSQDGEVGVEDEVIEYSQEPSAASEPRSAKKPKASAELELLDLPSYLPDEDREPLSAPKTKEGFAEVLEFANSKSNTGPLSYTIVIEKIDTKEIREAVMDALSDIKFRWNVRELFEHMENGKLELENLNPAKASVAVLKLRDLPVRIRWRQDVYS